MGSYLCKKKSDPLDPFQILPECSQRDEYQPNNVWLTVKPEPDKIIFVLLKAVTRIPLVYISITTQQEKMELYTVFDALNSFLLNSILKIRFFEREEFSFCRLKMVQEKESKNRDYISYQSNDDSTVAKQPDLKSKISNLDFIKRNYDDDEPMKCYKEQENEQKLVPVSDKEILYEYAESYYAGGPAYLNQNQIYCLIVEPRTSIREKASYQQTKPAQQRVIDSMKLIFPPFEWKPEYVYPKY